MRRCVIAVVFLLIPGVCFAADAKGNFSVKGAGLEKCSNYLKDHQERSPAYFLYRSWLNGYLSAYNQFTKDTYDIVPGLSINVLSAEMGAYCKRMPNQPFTDAALAVVMAHKDKRLKERPKTASATAPGGRKAIIHLQQVLKDRGYYKGAVDGSMGPETAAAIKAFQKAEHLPVTGKADAATMAKVGR